MALGKRIAGAVVNAYLGDQFAAVRRGWHKAKRRRRKLEAYLQIDDPYSCVLAQALLLLRDELRSTDLHVIVVPQPAVEVAPQPDKLALFAVRDVVELARRYAVDFPEDARPPGRRLVELANGAVLAAASGDPWALLETFVTVAKDLYGGEAAHDGVGSHEVVVRLRANDERRNKRGHYMSGVVHYEGEWYWGLDRLPDLLERLDGEGVAVDPAVLERDVFDAPVATSRDLDFYYSFRSPYSYLALSPLRALLARHELKATVKPVLPMVMRGFKVPLTKRLYIVKDARRVAQRGGIPFGRICDPIGPGIADCLAIFQYAEAEGRALEFLESAGRGCWAEALDVADESDMRLIVERAGLNWAEAQRAMKSDAWRARTEQNRQDLTELGLWGVPSFKLGDFSTWGQDRIWSLEARLGE